MPIPTAAFSWPFSICLMPPGKERSQESSLSNRRSPENSTSIAVILGPGRKLEKGRKVLRKGVRCKASSGDRERPLNLNMTMGLLFLLCTLQISVLCDIFTLLLTTILSLNKVTSLTSSYPWEQAKEAGLVEISLDGDGGEWGKILEGQAQKGYRRAPSTAQPQTRHM